jgi:hypothetical protein
MAMLLKNAYYVHVLQSLPTMHMNVYTSQHSYNLDVKSHLKLRYIKWYYIL